MRILYDYQIFNLQNYGGISRCFVELYKHLPDNCKATIGIHESDNVYARELEGIKPLGYQYENFILKGHFPGKGHLHLWYDNLQKYSYYPDYNKNYSIYLLKKGDFDVFHPTFFDDYFLPYMNGKPLVLTIHDMIPELYPQYFRKDDSQIIMRKKLAPLADAIVCVSEQTKQDVMRILNVPEEKIHVVYHGCSLSAKDGENSYKFPYLLYVGERGLYKNFTLFVKYIVLVLEKHKDLQVVCTGKPFNKEELMLLNKYNIGDRFHNCWVKTDQDLYLLYHYAECFIYPSEYEGFGIPILEAYQACCPVLLNNSSCFPEIAGDAAVFFDISREKSDLAEKIESVLEMTSAERDIMLQEQKVRLAKFSWQKSARQLAEIYQSLC